MLFYLTTLHVSNVLTDLEPTDPYVEGQNFPTEAQTADYKSAREIWISLEQKYKIEVACYKKFVVGKFLNFKMNDEKPVVKQVEELQIIVNELEVESMGINST